MAKCLSLRTPLVYHTEMIDSQPVRICHRLRRQGWSCFLFARSRAPGPIPGQVLPLWAAPRRLLRLQWAHRGRQWSGVGQTHSHQGLRSLRRQEGFRNSTQQWGRVLKLRQCRCPGTNQKMTVLKDYLQQDQHWSISGWLWTNCRRFWTILILFFHICKKMQHILNGQFLDCFENCQKIILTCGLRLGIHHSTGNRFFLFFFFFFLQKCQNVRS